MRRTAPEEDPEDFRLDGLFGGLLDPAEVRAGGGSATKFTAEQVALAGRRIDQAGILAKFQQWREDDRRGKGAGGRTSLLDDRCIMIACMLLLTEGSPMWVTEMSNVFWYRLTEDAREGLGIGHIHNTGVDDRDQRDWYFRVWRVLHRILDSMDAWPMAARNKLLTREQREEQISLRDKNDARLKRERLNWWTDAMIEMTVQAQPRRIRRQWKGSVSVDQTAFHAPSQKGRRSRDKETGLEIPMYNVKTDEEVHKYVLEIDADWYPVKSDKPRDRDKVVSSSASAPGSKRKKKAAPETEWEWDYMANFAIQTDENPTGGAKHPHLIISASVSTPNKDIGGEVVRAMQSILHRGHRISRLTTDKGYGPQLDVDNFHIPLKALGVPLVMDYNSNQLGIKSGHGGAVQVEGAHYCPATPEDLLEASVHMDQKLIDHHTYLKRIEERQHYKLRAKQSPDAEGHVPMICPAYGPGATVECPLRDVHPRSSKKVKPVVLAPPEFPDSICTKSYVDFGPEEGIKFEQATVFGSQEWEDTYKHDRNSIESHNEYIKHGPERLHDPTTRRLRGLAAQQFIVTMLTVSANLRKIARFLRDEARIEVPKRKYERRRDKEGMSRYVRWRTQIEMTAVKPEDKEPPETLPRT